MRFKLEKNSCGQGNPCEDAILLNNDIITQFGIDIDSLDDLMSFVEKHGSVIIDKDSITILDYGYID